MYSEEIEGFLRNRNYVVSPEECAELINTNINTQISRVKYYSFQNEYQIDTMDGYVFRFKVQ